MCSLCVSERDTERHNNSPLLSALSFLPTPALLSAEWTVNHKWWCKHVPGVISVQSPRGEEPGRAGGAPDRQTDSRPAVWSGPPGPTAEPGSWDYIASSCHITPLRERGGGGREMWEERERQRLALCNQCAPSPTNRDDTLRDDSIAVLMVPLIHVLLLAVLGNVHRQTCIMSHVSVVLSFVWVVITLHSLHSRSSVFGIPFYIGLSTSCLSAGWWFFIKINSSQFLKSPSVGCHTTSPL